MKFKAHDYQQYAIDFILSHPVCCLILDMGLGKTAITLTAMMELLFNYFLVGKVLVIAPKRVAESTWPAEIKKWEHLTGLTYSVVKGTAKQRNEALLRPADVYIIGRDNVTWLVEKKYFSFDLIVIDELSSFKSPKAQRFKSLRKVRPLASRVIGLTGTPGNPMDLWAEIGILDMGQRLGRFIGAYRERFFVPDKRNGEIIYSYKPRAGAEEQIYELISDISISMKAVDFLNMPECIYNQVKVQMSDTEKNLYERMEADMILQFGEGKDIDAVNAAALNNKLQQMANGAVYNESGEVQLIHDRKLDALEDLIEAANGKPLLVAYWFKHDRDRIMARFKVRDIDSAKDIEDWNAGKIPVASGASDSHAKTSPLPENNGDWSEKEVEYITTLLTSSKAKKKVISPHTFLLRTLRTCYRLMQDSILPPFCLKWTKRGMTVGGRCLIQKTSECHRTESVCSLSQILEAEVDEKYYLSAEKTQQLLTNL